MRYILLYMDLEFIGQSFQLLLQSPDLFLGTDGLLPLCNHLPLVAVAAQLHATLQLLQTHTEKVNKAPMWQHDKK